VVQQPLLRYGRSFGRLNASLQLLLEFEISINTNGKMSRKKSCKKPFFSEYFVSEKPAFVQKQHFLLATTTVRINCSG